MRGLLEGGGFETSHNFLRNGAECDLGFMDTIFRYLYVEPCHVENRYSAVCIIMCCNLSNDF